MKNQRNPVCHLLISNRNCIVYVLPHNVCFNSAKGYVILHAKVKMYDIDAFCRKQNSAFVRYTMYYVSIEKK